MTLPQDKIKERSISESYKQTEGAQCTEFTKGYRIGFQIGHEAGATEWAEKAYKLLEVLEKIVHAPVPANEREYISWFITAKNIAGGAISEWEADNALAKYKEVGNG